MSKEPELVWVREPCICCGAVTAAQAKTMCNPKTNGGHCPASDGTDDEGYIIAPTPDSLEAHLRWDELNN
jgi:hypothetical protein